MLNTFWHKSYLLLLSFLTLSS